MRKLLASFAMLNKQFQMHGLKVSATDYLKQVIAGRNFSDGKAVPFVSIRSYTPAVCQS